MDIKKSIPFNRPYTTGKEIEYIAAAINSHKHCGDGKYTKEVSAFFETTFGAKRALLTTSCSSALDMACLALDIGPGDEVIMPSFTFVSTANAVVLRGATIVFAEIDETLNIDLDDVKRKLTKNTRLVMPVHYASASCDMDRLMAMSREYGFYVVEDAAQAVYARYKDRWLGTIGHMGCYSFHETKNYSCGEGGALLINTDDLALVERAEIIREKGTNRSKFFRGEIDKYSWVGSGSSYLPSDLLAAHLLAQVEALDEINDMRGHVYRRYLKALVPYAQLGRFQIPKIPNYNTINHHMFYLLFHSGKERDAMMAHLKKNGINAVFHYLPLHTSNMGIKMGNKVGDLPFTEKISDTLLRLPLYAGMAESDIDYILHAIKTFY